MKLYSFWHNDYGTSYHIMSDSKENALKAIVKYLKKKVDEEVKGEIHLQNSWNDGRKPLYPIYNDNECIFYRSDGTTYTCCMFEELQIWKQATADDLPKAYYSQDGNGEKIRDIGYDIIEYGINEVIETESC